jgi:hypothetical protein
MKRRYKSDRYRWIYGIRLISWVLYLENANPSQATDIIDNMPSQATDIIDNMPSQATDIIDNMPSQVTDNMAPQATDDMASQVVDIIDNMACHQPIIN